jgi:hypothetical protein
MDATRDPKQQPATFFFGAQAGPLELFRDWLERKLLLEPEVTFPSPEHEAKWSADFSLDLARRLRVEKLTTSIVALLACIALICVRAQNLDIGGPLLFWFCIVTALFLDSVAAVLVSR